MRISLSSSDLIRKALLVAVVIFSALSLMTCSIFLYPPRDLAYRDIETGAERVELYLPILEDKAVGIVANHTSTIGDNHLVDSLLSLGVDIKRVFTLEHGFRGTADAGEKVSTTVDERTGLPLISLYGERLKPAPDDMKDLDIVIFDIQDVGARFYTYISSMHYVMEACAENDVSFLVLDRPNPNGFYVDGPVLDSNQRSFVGMHPVPIVHGMTVAEYASMVNGEGWLKGGIEVDLDYVLCEGYDHNTLYRLPVRPSPNLSTQLSIYLYPSICLFEGTMMSVGRGTPFPFETFGHPRLINADFQFIPTSTEGARNPPLLGEVVNAVYLSGLYKPYIQNKGELDLGWLLFAYNNTPRDIDFFNGYFPRLAGNDRLQHWIEEGMSIADIRSSWERDIEEFKKIRRKYLLYRDFE